MQLVCSGPIAGEAAEAGQAWERAGGGFRRRRVAHLPAQLSWPVGRLR